MFHLNRIIFALQNLNKVVQNAHSGRLFHTSLFYSDGNNQLNTPCVSAFVGDGKGMGSLPEKGIFMGIYDNGLTSLAM
jgi:hypothetical protein